MRTSSGTPAPTSAPMATGKATIGVLALAILLPIGAAAARLSSAASSLPVHNIRTAADGRSSEATGDDAQVASRIAALRSRLDMYSDEAADDLVPHLPGYGAVNDFNLFAGYITVDDDAGRALFYILAEATGDGPATDAASRESAADEGSNGGGSNGRRPLVLWLNGGPGCSSIGGGFMSELGPFFPTPGGQKLQRNPYAWNSFASVLFVESPAFVGFSYSNTTEDAIVGDARTAADSRIFMLRFLDRFPRYRSAPFYISGESYAGHYVPNLALAIVEGNKAAATTGEPKINFQGFLVGNPWTDTAIDNLGAVDYWWTHAIVSDQTAQGIRANCNFSRIGPLDPHPNHANAQTRDELCDDFCNRAFDELGSINIYEIYADLCSEPPAVRRQVEALSWALGGSGASGAASTSPHLALGSHAAAAAAAATAAAEEPPQMRRRLLQQQPHGAQEALTFKSSRMSFGASGDGADPGYDPCVDDEVETYLNLPEVQRALHANQTVRLPWRWNDCTRSIVYSREDLLASMLPVYRRLLQANLRILVYSGDVDGIVPVVGTRRWVASLMLKEKESWRPWMLNGQVGGYVVEYAGLTFATVRGAGHMVPYVQPARAFQMARSFLEGYPL